jgi:anti-sigma regulatory factor (Ser/Thr protein kinase)
VLHSWDLDRIAEVAELLTDELVSNVVRHVGAPMLLRITRGPTAVRIEVDDPSSIVPVQQDPDPMEDHGRGIFLVETLASSWGVEVRDDGKTVWFEIDVAVHDEVPVTN